MFGIENSKCRLGPCTLDRRCFNQSNNIAVVLVFPSSNSVCFVGLPNLLLGEGQWEWQKKMLVPYEGDGDTSMFHEPLHPFPAGDGVSNASAHSQDMGFQNIRSFVFRWFNHSHVSCLDCAVLVLVSTSPESSVQFVLSKCRRSLIGRMPSMSVAGHLDEGRPATPVRGARNLLG